jgi:hypothetical protein
MQNALNHVREGMKVVDQAHETIGTVEWVRLSDEDPSTPQPEIVEGSAEQPDRSPVDTLARLQPDRLPGELRARLLREGFIRVEGAGLFGPDRYVLPKQIQSVSQGEVTLKVAKAELIKEP